MKMSNKAIQLYGSPEELKVYGGRIKAMMPGGQVYSDTEAMGLAQLCLAHDLDAFNGEAWLIKVRGQSRGMMVGIKGLRKHAKRQSPYWGKPGADRVDGFRRILDPKELELYKATPKDIVFELIIIVKEDVDHWLDTVARLQDLGLDIALAGDCPETVGIGIWKDGEGTMMSPVQAAMYRAERDAIRRRFDVSFSVPGWNVDLAKDDQDFDEPEDDYINGDVEVIDTNQIIAELGFSVDTGVPDVTPYQPQPEPDQPVRPYGPEALKEAFVKLMTNVYDNVQEEDLKENERKIVLINMEKLFKEKQTERRHMLTDHLFGKTSTKDLSPAEVKCLTKWLAAKPDNGGDWNPTGHCFAEANMVIAALSLAELEKQPALL